MSPSDTKASRASRIGVALPSALMAALFLGVVAFGATAPSSADRDGAEGRPASEAPATEPKPDEVAPDGPEPTPRPKDESPVEPIEQPNEDPALFPRTPSTAPPKESERPSEEPKPAETDAPKPAESKKPESRPDTTTTLVLEGWAKEARAKLAWKPYVGSGFEYYKVVRSADATVTWPATGEDVVVAAIEDREATWWADKPPCGTAWTYRVFAVRHGEAGYVTLAASNAVTITTACGAEPTPKPEGCGMGFEVWAKPGVGIKLAWEPCHHEAFVAYRVVRSQTNPDPRFPLNDGTELVAVIHDRHSTAFLDELVAAGETWTYRVVAVAGEDASTVIGQSAARAATAE